MIADLVGTEAAAKVWSSAWAEGHSYGFSEVENYYADFAEIANTAAQAILAQK